MADDTFTPNLHLRKIAGNRHNWNEAFNENLDILDALVAAYFPVSGITGIWENATAYSIDNVVVDPITGVMWRCVVDHISASLPTTFAEDRTTHPDLWVTFSIAATNRGVWTPNTKYNLNDFVVGDGTKYAVCIVAHTSDADFDTDVTAGKWSVLIDVSSVGTSVLPTPGGSGDGNKAVVTNPAGNGYIITSMDGLLTLLGATTIGKALLRASSTGAGRAAINAQVAGSYQAFDSTLNALSGKPTTNYGMDLLNIVNAAAMRSKAGLGTIATHAATEYLTSTGMVLVPGANGRVTFPLGDFVGFTIQWVQCVVNAGTTGGSSWPAPFTGGPYSIQVTAGADTTFYLHDADANGFNISNTGIVNNANFLVLAIGFIA